MLVCVANRETCLHVKASTGIQRLTADSFERMLKDVLDLRTGRRKLACISTKQIPERVKGSAFATQFTGVQLKLPGC